MSAVITYLAYLDWFHARWPHVKHVDVVRRSNCASLRTRRIEVQDVSDSSLLPTLQAFLYLFRKNLGLKLLVDLKSVLVNEAGLEVVLVGIPEQIRKDLRFLLLAVEV